MLTESIENALNRQIVEELYASHLYLSMEAYCETLALEGAARWLSHQSREEYGHAKKIFDYINDRNGKVRLGQVNAPPHEWSSPLALFEDAYRHEQNVTAAIGKLIELAKKEGDHLTFSFLQWFADEQVEEEDSVSRIVDRFKIAGSDGSALLLLDKELGEREGE